MRSWFLITSASIPANVLGYEREVAFERALPAVQAMAEFLDETFPRGFKPFVPLMAVGIAFPSPAEQAQQAVPKANPPLPPSQGAADMSVDTARAEAISTIGRIFNDPAPAQQAQPARVRTPSPSVPPHPSNWRSGVVTVPLTRGVLALLTEVRNGEPISFEELSNKILDEFPKPVLQATGFIELFTPSGDAFDDCIRNFIEVCQNLPTAGLESPRTYDTGPP